MEPNNRNQRSSLNEDENWDQNQGRQALQNDYNQSRNLQNNYNEDSFDLRNDYRQNQRSNNRWQE